jgi:hypothetical protein
VDVSYVFTDLAIRKYKNGTTTKNNWENSKIFFFGFKKDLQHYKANFYKLATC